MSTVPKSDHASILSLSGSDTGLEKASSSTPTSPPTHVFRVRQILWCLAPVAQVKLVTQVHNGRSAQWEDLRLSSAKKKTLFCFHGSRTDNFHSILSHGLQQHLNKARRKAHDDTFRVHIRFLFIACRLLSLVKASTSPASWSWR